MNQSTLLSELKLRGIELNETQLNQFDTYMNLLIEWNQRMNLTAIIEPEEINEKHFLDCLCLVNLIDPKANMADIGSGAGFPAIPLLIALPDLRVTMVEPIAKRTLFLKEVIKQLNLKNAVVLNERSEDLAKTGREKFDVVSARAVASLPILCEICVPLLKVGGNFVAMKGSSGLEEVEEAKNAMRILKLKVKEIKKEVLPSAGLRYNIVLNKTESTPLAYPRPYAQIKKRPL